MIAAVVLAAGLSRRMGQFKLLLPWGEGTVIGRVVQVLTDGGVEEVVVVTGAGHELLQQALKGTAVRLVFNPRYQDDQMVHSLQVGLSSLPESCEATLVALGDQPQIQVQVVQRLLQAYGAEPAPLIIPSYQRRRGHPWLLHRSLWPALQALPEGSTLRTFLNDHAQQIRYVEVDTESILRDLDTPEDYQRERPVG